MFTRNNGIKVPKSGHKVVGSIASVNDHRVVVEISESSKHYHKGQHIIVSIPGERKTALGKIRKVSEVVAHGKITNISGNLVTIQSKQSNPIISGSALRENEGKKV